MIFYGASGHAAVVLEAWIASGQKVTAIVDDNEEVKSLLHFSVTGKYDPVIYRGHLVMLSIGSNQIRKRLAEKIAGPYGQVIHPTTNLSPSSVIGEGTVVLAGCTVNANTKIGRHVILNTACSLDHDCVINDFAHISPGATLCGNVVVGEGTQVGAGATIIQNITIGKWAVIGAGSVVVKDVPDGAVVMGVPARLSRHQELPKS